MPQNGRFWRALNWPVLRAHDTGALLRGNDYMSFGSNPLYSQSPDHDGDPTVATFSALEVPTYVYYSTAAAGSTSSNFPIQLWDDGPSSLSWSVNVSSIVYPSGPSGWLSIYTGDSYTDSGTIGGEDDNTQSTDNTFQLVADASDLSAGTYWAIVTITAGSQTKAITVWFTVT